MFKNLHIFNSTVLCPLKNKYNKSILYYNYIFCNKCNKKISRFETIYIHNNICTNNNISKKEINNLLNKKYNKWQLIIKNNN